MLFPPLHLAHFFSLKYLLFFFCIFLYIRNSYFILENILYLNKMGRSL